MISEIEEARNGTPRTIGLFLSAPHMSRRLVSAHGDGVHPLDASYWHGSCLIKAGVRASFSMCSNQEQATYLLCAYRDTEVLATSRLTTAPLGT